MAKIVSFGTSVSVASNIIGGLTGVDIPETDINDVETTTHDTPGGNRTYAGGLKDGGVMTLSGLYDIENAGQAYLRNKDNQGGEPVACTVVFSDGSEAEFEAVVKGYGVSVDLDGSVVFTSSLRISGPVDYTAGA